MDLILSSMINFILGRHPIIRYITTITSLQTVYVCLPQFSEERTEIKKDEPVCNKNKCLNMPVLLVFRREIPPSGNTTGIPHRFSVLLKNIWRPSKTITC